MASREVSFNRWQSVAISSNQANWSSSVAVSGSRWQSVAIMVIPARQLELMCIQMIEETWEAAEDCIIGQL